jgi:nucleotide-binding universal stress UspA family protein
MLPGRLTEARSYLAEVIQRPDLAGIKTERAILVGLAAEAILDAVRSHQADVIVICSHGRTGVTRWALGSVANHVVHHSPVPVLVVRQQGTLPGEPVAAGARPFRVLVPLDGSALAEAALLPAASLAAGLAAPEPGALQLVQIVHHERHQAHEATAAHQAREAALQEAESYLAVVAERLRSGSLAPLKLQVSWSAVWNLDVAAGLIDAAEQGIMAQGQQAGGAGPCDLIAMATHGRTGPRRWVMGSITERVLRGTKLPLLVVRPQEAHTYPVSLEGERPAAEALP